MAPNSSLVRQNPADFLHRKKCLRLDETAYICWIIFKNDPTSQTLKKTSTKENPAHAGFLAGFFHGVLRPLFSLQPSAPGGWGPCFYFGRSLPDRSPARRIYGAGVFARAHQRAQVCITVGSTEHQSGLEKIIKEFPLMVVAGTEGRCAKLVGEHR